MTSRSVDLWGAILFGSILCFFLVVAGTGASLLAFFWFFMILVGAWETGLSIRYARKAEEKAKGVDHDLYDEDGRRP